MCAPSSGLLHPPQPGTRQAINDRAHFRICVPFTGTQPHLQKPPKLPAGLVNTSVGSELKNCRLRQPAGLGEVEFPTRPISTYQ